MKRNFAAAAILIAILPGCSSIRLHRGAASQPSAQAAIERYKFMFWGFYPIDQAVDLSERCPGGWSELESHVDLLDASVTGKSQCFFDIGHFVSGSSRPECKNEW